MSVTAKLATVFLFGLVNSLIGAVPFQLAAGAENLPAGVACLLEDNGAELLPLLTNPGGDLGEGEVEKNVVFSGESAVKVTAYQKYFNLLPGWAYPVKEHPGEGEYRYLRFAWKAEGLPGIMLQLHDDKDWHIRYLAGANKLGWDAKPIAASPPNEWTVVTVDLFKDFGEREIHGLALTTFDSAAGYFDHIYLARTSAELDAIDATGLNGKGPLELAAADVEKHWKDLGSSDAATAYRAFWTLAAGGESARGPLAARLPGETLRADAAAIEIWLRELDDEDFAIRERASARLMTHFAAAEQQIEATLKQTGSVEVRARLTRICESGKKPATEAERMEQQTRRILEIIAQRVK